MYSRRRAAGNISNPPSTAAGGASDQFFAFADGTEIGTSGKVAAGAGANSVELSIDDGQAAGVSGNGLSGQLGGIWWDLGDTLTGAINLTFTWVTIVKNTNVTLVAWRDTGDPTVVQDIEDADCRILQMFTNASVAVSTYLKQGTGGLGTFGQENKTDSTVLSLMVLMDANETGGSQSKHTHGATSTGRYLNSESATPAGGFYVGVFFSKTATSTEAEVISFTLRGGMPS